MTLAFKMEVEDTNDAKEQKGGEEVILFVSSYLLGCLLKQVAFEVPTSSSRTNSKHCLSYLE